MTSSYQIQNRVVSGGWMTTPYQIGQQFYRVVSTTRRIDTRRPWEIPELEGEYVFSRDQTDIELQTWLVVKMTEKGPWLSQEKPPQKDDTELVLLTSRKFFATKELALREWLTGEQG